ncbi:MAG: exodeoxyribonuclease VII large subunit [Bacteriovoracia bacterium]
MQINLELPKKTNQQPTEPIPEPKRNLWTVSQLTAKVKGLLETDLTDLWIRGEISGFRPSSSGHLYFSLKDSNAVLSCAVFGRRNFGFQLKDGLEVVVHGKVSVYPPRGTYQLIIDRIEPLGHGALQLAFQQLKEKLEKEGLFSLERKKKIPAFPSRIAIITSPTGAALQDMINVLTRRNGGIGILVIPTQVQGAEAAPKIAEAVRIANQHRLGDILILARGGGSIEDLWCFNDERVVRAIAASQIPTISAIGHEVDFTLSDFAADLRAPTPSAAAELVSKSRVELLDAIEIQNRRLLNAVLAKLSRFKSQILAVERNLVSPSERLNRLRKILSECELKMLHSIESRPNTYRQMLDDVFGEIQYRVEAGIQSKKSKFEKFLVGLEALSPLKVLGRGYTLIEDPKTKGLLKSVTQVQGEQEVLILFHDGKVPAHIAKGRS